MGCLYSSALWAFLINISLLSQLEANKQTTADGAHPSLQIYKYPKIHPSWRERKIAFGATLLYKYTLRAQQIYPSWIEKFALCPIILYK